MSGSVKGMTSPGWRGLVCGDVCPRQRLEPQVSATPTAKHHKKSSNKRMVETNLSRHIKHVEVVVNARLVPAPENVHLGPHHTQIHKENITEKSEFG